MESYKPWKDMTRAELEQIIRWNTVLVNERINEYRENGKEYKDVESAIKNMKDISGVKRGRLGAEVGIGALHSKNKAGLIRQARELNSFLMWDVTTPAGQRQLEEREKKEWESFHSLHKNYTYEEWRNLVEVFGAVGSKLVEEYGSENIRQVNQEVMRGGKNVNLADLLLKVQRSLTKNRLVTVTPETLLDELRFQISQI